MSKMLSVVLLLLGVASLTAVACGSETIVEVTREREVVRDG